jgi:hypothetical protein
VAAPSFDQARAPYDGAVATEAALSDSLAVAPDGSILVANGDLWRIGLDGRVTRIAGNGRCGFAGDGGPATAANVDAQEVAATAEGAVLIVDTSHHRIRRVGPDGIITTVAGSGPTQDNKPGAFAGDGGPATQARLNFPSDVTSTSDGGFLIAEEIGDRIRRVAPDGTITTVAGAGTDPGPSAGSVGDGGPATAALLSRPVGVAEMSDGRFVIADSGNARVRRVAPDGTISTLAGAGARGGTPTTTARFEPRSVAVGPGGDIVFSDDTGTGSGA